MPTHKSTTRLIEYPYIHPDGQILYIGGDSRFMQSAKQCASLYSQDATMPNASIIVHNNVIVGRGANGSEYHRTHGCKRVELGIPTGQGYELCEGCHPKNHSEQKAIADARAQGSSTRKAILYLWGHWWCCEPCWQAMTAAGIKTVYLLERSEILFNKDAPGNIVGKSFA